MSASPQDHGTQASAQQGRQRQEWHYHPDFPIDNNPLFSWPIRWRDWFLWLNVFQANAILRQHARCCGDL